MHKIITELEAEQYIMRRRVGRNNEYYVNSHNQLRLDTNIDVTVEDFLDMLGWKRDEALYVFSESGTDWPSE